ncbi:MAG: hypothetical protein ACLVI6_08120 [Bifidobacterium bifidum]
MDGPASVAKYAGREPPAGALRIEASKLDPFKATVDGWRGDWLMPRKAGTPSACTAGCSEARTRRCNGM